MTITPVGVGASANDGTGDSLRSLAQTVNLIIAALGGVGTANPVVKYATAAALAANTYAAGVLTATANGALSVDGSTPVVADRILVKGEVSQLKNGVYVVTTVGTAGTPYVLTRASDYATWDELAGTVLFVQQGTANANSVWLSTADAGGTLGTTAVAYVGLPTLALANLWAAVQTFTLTPIMSANLQIGAAIAAWIGGNSTNAFVIDPSFGIAGRTTASIEMLLDANNDDTTRVFRVRVNSAVLGSGGTVVFEVNEAGNAYIATSIELGAVADCSLTRAAAGTLAVEGVNVLTTATGAQLAAANTFTSGMVLSQTSPNFYFVETDAAVNNKKWRFIANGEDFYFQTLNDAEDTAGSIFIVARNGTGIDSITVGGPILVPAGSAAAPSLAGSADANTGYTFDGSGILGIVTGGTKRVTITTTAILDEANGAMTIGGNGSKRFGDVNLASGKKLTFNSGNAGATQVLHSSDKNTWTGETVLDGALGPTSVVSAGFRGLGSPSVKTADYTFVLNDAGQMVRCNSGTSKNFTIPTFASVAFPNGTLIPVSNYGAGTCVILAPSGGTLYDEDGTSGSVTLNTHHGGVIERDADSGTNVWRYRGQHA